jgi:type II secretion system protein G
MKKIGAVVMMLDLVGSTLMASRATAAQSPAAEATKDVKAEAAIQQAKADLMALVSALQMFKLNAGVYPTVEQGLVSLMEKPGQAPVPRRWVQLVAKLPKDPWGAEYRYITRKKDGKILHVVVSEGPDPISEKDNLEDTFEDPKL